MIYKYKVDHRVKLFSTKNLIIGPQGRIIKRISHKQVLQSKIKKKAVKAPRVTKKIQ